MKKLKVVTVMTGRGPHRAVVLTRREMRSLKKHGRLTIFRRDRYAIPSGPTAVVTRTLFGKVRRPIVFSRADAMFMMAMARGHVWALRLTGCYDFPIIDRTVANQPRQDLAQAPAEPITVQTAVSAMTELAYRLYRAHPTRPEGAGADFYRAMILAVSHLEGKFADGFAKYLSDSSKEGLKFLIRSNREDALARDNGIEK